MINLSSTFNAQSNHNNLIGIDFGFDFVGAKPEKPNPTSNLNFIYLKRVFCLKLNLGYSNSEKFNNIFNGGIKLGITSNIEKRFFGNFLIGAYKSIASQLYQGTEYNGGLISAETNLLFNAFKSKKHLLGINICGFRYRISNRLPLNVDYAASFKLSYYFKIEHKK